MPGVMVRSRSRTSGRPPSDFVNPRVTRRRRVRRCRMRRSSMPAGAVDRAGPRVVELGHEAARLLDPALGLGGARLGAPPQPFDLAPDGVGERLLVGGLAAQELVAAREKLAVRPVGLEEPVGIGAVQLDHAGGHVLEEVAVVAHDEDGARPLGEDVLQPEDAFDVEMVGRLVHQEHVGLGGERPRDGQALPPAAGQRVDGGVPVGEAAAAEGEGDAAGPVAFVHSRQGGGDDRFLDSAAARGRDPGGRSRLVCRPERSACRGRERSRPARILRRVDLPEPFGPTRPTWSPSKSPNDSSSKSARVP